MKDLITIETIEASEFPQQLNSPLYSILLFEGETSFSVDLNEYSCQGKNLLFTSPYQLLSWHRTTAKKVSLLRFHGDFYCIEYHKKEVACNGVLFNNIYQQPFVKVPGPVFEEVSNIILKMKLLAAGVSRYDSQVLRSYLQLILALGSKEKLLQNGEPQPGEIAGFQEVLEKQFRAAKDVAFYSGSFGLSVGAFSKKVKRQYGKSPSKLIQERIVLEAKKLLHLTYKPVKEIAAELGFEDEFYFSRYFKKEVGVSPRKYREDVGISIVAKLSR